MPTPRKPDAIHDLNGTRRPSRHGRKGDDDKFVVPGGIPACPDFVTGRAADEWKRLTAILAPLNVLTVGDLAGLAQYCLLYGQLGNNPEDFTAAQHCQLRMLLQEFGLTPASRHKVSPIEADKAADPWDDLDQAH